MRTGKAVSGFVNFNQPAQTICASAALLACFVSSLRTIPGDRDRGGNAVCRTADAAVLFRGLGDAVQAVIGAGGCAVCGIACGEIGVAHRRRVAGEIERGIDRGSAVGKRVLALEAAAKAIKEAGGYITHRGRDRFGALRCNRKSAWRGKAKRVLCAHSTIGRIRRGLR